jgi:EmrB/QacA subfamily drug resistance transporter
MLFRQSATAAINALVRRRIRRRARARYERRHAADGTKALSPRTTALIVASALFMEQLDGTVLATALPEMARSFGTEAVRLNVALTSYLLALAVFIPASGKVADRFGSRTVFCAAIALFTVGSMLCGQADRLGTLVAARVLQGIGGAMMVPVGRLVLLRSVTKAEMVTAMTWLMIPAQLGPLLGPPVGGFLVTYLSWRWIFYINVPIGILGIALALRFIEDVREPGRVSFDLPGLVMSGLSLACLVFGLEAVSRGGSSLALAGGALATGVVAGALYVRHARHHPAPVLDLRLMRVPTFALSVIGGGLSRVAAGAVPFLLPLMLQLGFGMSAAASGLITFGGSVGSMLMRFVARPVLHRWGFRTTMVWNGLIASGFLGALALMRPSWPPAAILGLLVVGGFFQSLQFTAYNTIAYADIPRDRMSAATSFYTTFQQLNLTLGICVAAGALAGSVLVTGHGEPQVADYSAAFLVVAAVSLLASPTCTRLARNAGDELSGRAPVDRRG